MYIERCGLCQSKNCHQVPVFLELLLLTSWVAESFDRSPRAYQFSTMSMSNAKLPAVHAIMATYSTASQLLHWLRRRVMLFLELGRVKFLLYSPIAYAAGVTCATAGNSADSFSLKLFLIGQLFVSCTHMLTHFFNEYYDFPADLAHQFPSPWTGGSRVLVSGRVLPNTSYWFGWAMTAVSMSLVFGGFPSVETKVLGVVIIIFSIGYSAPPLEMGTNGLGEFDVMLVLNTLVPLLGFLLHRNGESDPSLLLWLLPPAVVEFVRMMVMNMADVVGDTRARKLTLVVRLGLDRSVFVHLIGMTVAYLCLVGLFLGGIIPVTPFLLQVATLPMAGFICHRVYFQKDYLSLPKFYNLPYLSTQHNGLILLAALLGLAISDDHRRMSSSLSQIRLLAAYLFFIQNGLKAWKGWRNGNLSLVFNPEISKADRSAKSEQIGQWEGAIEQATRPFSHNHSD